MAPQAARLQAECVLQVSVILQYRKDAGVDEEGVRRVGEKSNRYEI